MSVLGSRIKKERERLELNRDELGKKIGVSYSAIAMYEQGNREPNNELTIKMCEIFNCSMDYLIGLTSYRNPKEDLEKELYELDLNENEFDEMVSLLIDKDIDDIDNVLRSNNKISLACHKCLDLVFSYIDEKDKTLDENVNKLINIIKSLDKNNIIHDSIKKNKIDNKTFSTNTQYYMCPVYGQISAGQPNWAEECIEGRIPIAPNLMNIVNPEEHFFLRVNGESMNEVVKNGAYALIHKQDIVDDGEIAVVLVNGYNATLKKFSKQGDFVILEPMSTVTDDPEIKTQIYDKNTSIKILGKYVGKFEINK